jgi:hypothetical protein
MEIPSANDFDPTNFDHRMAYTGMGNAVVYARTTKYIDLLEEKIENDSELNLDSIKQEIRKEVGFDGS